MIPAEFPKGMGQTQATQGQGKAGTEISAFISLSWWKNSGFMVGRSHCTLLRPSQRKTQANITHRRGSGQPLPTVDKYALTSAEGNLAPSGQMQTME